MQIRTHAGKPLEVDESVSLGEAIRKIFGGLVVSDLSMLKGKRLWNSRRGRRSFIFSGRVVSVERRKP